MANDLAQILKFLYSEFVLRDIVGYSISGTILFAAILIATQEKHRLIPLINADFKRSAGVWVITFALSYLIGHASAGLSFNICEFNIAYSYYPKNSGIVTDSAMMLWNENYRLAVERLPAHDALKYQRERLTALQHVTGYGSASFLFSGIILLIGSIKKRAKPEEYKLSLRNKNLPEVWPPKLRFYLSIILFIISLGLYFHYHRLTIRKYYFEKIIIES